MPEPLSLCYALFPMEETIRDAVLKRRTFAIISHPDAGKTTLTEKLLLYSGQIQAAGMVKGRKGRKSATSDWMAMEQERGISITSSAMQFPYKDVIINVLDTPGHEDFSEDTYRTLSAADCAIMVIDASKGVEKQTRKLFEVCHLRKIPVLTLINKMDMPGKEPLDLMNEVENVLGVASYAYNWPIGMGREFRGVYDRKAKECLFFHKVSIGGALKAAIERGPIPETDPQLREELELLDLAGNCFEKSHFLSGDVTPVFFASALTNFGIEPFFDAFIELAPPPTKRLAILSDGSQKSIDPLSPSFSGFVFKLQANMDKKHRDSMAFIRICSGKLEKDSSLKLSRTKKPVRLSRPHGIVAGERATLKEAFAGDVIGVINPGVFSIGDTLCPRGDFAFPPLPRFQPEIFAKLYPKDISKRKSFDKGIDQLSNEGAIQLLFSWENAGEVLFAAVGKLQFEVMQYRLQNEYGVETVLTLLPYQCSAWIKGDMENFEKTSSCLLAKDKKGYPIALFTSVWDKQYCIKQNPQHTLVDILT